MNEARRESYQNLIQSLLNCPNGEENQILQANSELVDAGLVQVMLERANDLRTYKNLNDANSLMTIAGYLLGTYNNTIINKSSPSNYLDFLMEVLRASSNSDGNSNVIYPLLQDNLKLVNDNLSAVLRSWASESLANLDSQDIRTSYTALIFNFSNAIWEFPLGSKTSNLEIAIAGYEVAMTVFTRQEYVEYWARVQNNLANAYSERIRGERADNIEMAIECFQAALSVYTREAFPFEWATTKNNLAATYNNRIRGEKADNLERAIELSKAALSVHTRDAFPFEWAQTQNNLANAYSYRIRGEKVNNLERSIKLHQAALSIYTRDAFPFEWARSKNNLALAYLHRIRGEKAENLETATELSKASLSVYTRDAFPFEWAQTQNNLGEAYRQRIRGEKGIRSINRGNSKKEGSQIRTAW